MISSLLHCIPSTGGLLTSPAEGGHTYGQGGHRMGLKTQRGEGRTARCLGVVGVLLSTLLGAECRKP